MKPPFYYSVNFCFQKSKNNITGLEEVEDFEKAFINDNPITARKEAISFFISYLESVLASRGIEYLDIRTAYENLRDIFYPSTRTYSQELNMFFPDFVGKRAGVSMIINSPLSDDEGGGSYTVIGLSDYSIGSNSVTDLLMSLGIELNYYRQFNLNTDSLEESVLAYDGDDNDIQSYPIISVPINWEKMGVRPDTLEESNIRLEDFINEGESELIEFKPSLIYNFGTNGYARPYFQKIPQAICAFLNSNNGGLLFIGVKDDGSIQGINDFDYSLSQKDNPKDYFLLQFDRMMNTYFKPFVQTYLDFGIRKIQGKDIFVLKVRPSTTPVFLSTKDRQDQIDYQFFYRTSSSSREVRDQRELVEYCLARFKTSEN